VLNVGLRGLAGLKPGTQTLKGPKIIEQKKLSVFQIISSLDGPVERRANGSDKAIIRGVWNIQNTPKTKLKIGSDYSAGRPHNGFRYPADRCS